MTLYTVVNQDIFGIGDYDPFVSNSTLNISADVTPFVTRLSVSLTMDASSEIQFDVVDEGFRFASNDYFHLRRNVYYRDQIFEISRVDVSQDASSSPLYSIAARSKNIQMMKRDKDPEGYSGITATDFASTIAARFGMSFFGQPTSGAKNIVKGSNSRVDESVWDVLQRLASDNQFTVFETANTLFFTSQEYLLGKWGDPEYTFMDKLFIPVAWPDGVPELPGSGERYPLYEMPSVGKSDDDWTFAEGSLLMDRTNGVNLRPGMTINLNGIPDFEGLYLITAVEFEEGVPDPVRISFRSPNDPDPPAPGGGGANGGYSSGTPTGKKFLPANIETRITEYIQRFYNPGEVPIAGLTKPQFYSDKYRAVTSEAIFQATEIYLNYSQSESTISDAIDSLRNSSSYRERFGNANIIYQALNSVETLFVAALTPAQKTLPAYPRNVITDAVEQIFGEQFMSTDTVRRILQNLFVAGSAVYFSASTAAKESELQKRKAAFGVGTTEYEVMSKKNVVDALIPKPISVFDQSFVNVF